MLAASLQLAPAQVASPTNYLASVVGELEKGWPSNHAVNIVFHGHSVPAGYFKTPAVDSLHAYPHLLRVALAEQFPHAVINVIVTAIGGENAVKGAARFEDDVLAHKPALVFIDYGLNDRRIGLDQARGGWDSMIRKAQAAGARVILLTPTPDQSAKPDDPNDPLNQHAGQIRQLAAEFQVGLVDSLALFQAETARGTALSNLMSQVNHPNARGHALVAAELLKWFPPSPPTNPPAPPRSAAANIPHRGRGPDRAYAAFAADSSGEGCLSSQARVAHPCGVPTAGPACFSLAARPGADKLLAHRPHSSNG